MTLKRLFVVVFIALLLGCKEERNATKPKISEEKQKISSVAKVPPIIKDLATFAYPSFSDTTNIDSLMVFKEIDTNGSITQISMIKAVDLYKKLISREHVNSRPIFELKDTEMAILPLQGFGFGGAIWANVLVDKSTLEIKKIAFDHKAESEGYGAVITQNSFENQFIGTKINLEQNTVTIQEAIEKAVDNGQVIDGLSGATMTSQGLAQMLNEGLRKYRSYINQN